LTIGGADVMVETGSIFDLFGGGGAPLQRSGVPVTVTARALPAAARPAGAVHVGRYTLEGRLDRTQVATGDAGTMTAVLRAAGNGTADAESEPANRVEGAGNATSEDDLRFGPVRTETALARHGESISRAWWFAPAAAVPPLAWLSFMFWGFARRRMDARAVAGAPARAVRQARQRLADAERLAAAAD